MFFSGRDWENSQDWGKDERSKVQRDLWWKPAPEHSDWGESSPSNRTTTLSTQPSQRSSGFGASLWMSRARTSPMEHLRRDIKIAVQRCSPSNLTELEKICREEWEKLPKYRCAKLVASYPRRLKAVIATKGASTNYWVKGLNTYVNVIFKFFFLHIWKHF